MTKKTDKFICPICDKIVTWEDIREDVSNGGVGMCSCNFLDEKIYHDYMTLKEYKKRIGTID